MHGVFRLAAELTARIGRGRELRSKSGSDTGAEFLGPDYCDESITAGSLMRPPVTTGASGEMDAGYLRLPVLARAARTIC